MSASHDSTSWIERNWQVFVILYGLVFVSILVSFHPTN